MPSSSESVSDVFSDEEEMALLACRNRVEAALWPLWNRLTWRMDRVRADVVWSSLWSRHVRIGLTILFMPHGYSLSATNSRVWYDAEAGHNFEVEDE